MHLTQATAFDGKVLCKDKDCTTIDRTIASYNPITRQVFLFLAEIGATMFHKFIKLYKTALVQKRIDAFTSRHLSGIVLFGNSFGTAASFYCFVALQHIIDFFSSSQMRYPLMDLYRKSKNSLIY